MVLKRQLRIHFDDANCCQSAQRFCVCSVDRDELPGAIAPMHRGEVGEPPILRSGTVLAERRRSASSRTPKMQSLR